MEVCGNSGGPYPKFSRRNEGKLVQHQFDVKDAIARHQETMICQVTQGALELGNLGPVCSWWDVLRSEGGVMSYITVIKIKSNAPPFTPYVTLVES
jgi:hypothetical protein